MKATRRVHLCISYQAQPQHLNRLARLLSKLQAVQQASDGIVYEGRIGTQALAVE